MMRSAEQKPACRPQGLCGISRKFVIERLRESVYNFSVYRNTDDEAGTVL